MLPLLPPGMELLLRVADAFMRAVLVLFIFGLAELLAQAMLRL